VFGDCGSFDAASPPTAFFFLLPLPLPFVFRLRLRLVGVSAVVDALIVSAAAAAATGVMVVVVSGGRFAAMTIRLVRFSDCRKVEADATVGVDNADDDATTATLAGSAGADVACAHTAAVDDTPAAAAVVVDAIVQVTEPSAAMPGSTFITICESVRSTTIDGGGRTLGVVHAGAVEFDSAAAVDSLAGWSSCDSSSSSSSSGGNAIGEVGGGGGDGSATRDTSSPDVVTFVSILACDVRRTRTTDWLADSLLFAAHFASQTRDEGETPPGTT
jgi:hypothetical protein